MELTNDVLRYDEQVIMRLRALYRQFGYTPYRMSRFEEYELYAANKAFLSSGEIITFTGAGGKLMALRPDVTLSIVKNIKDDAGLRKLYYNENVYRPDGYAFREQMQVGLECIGEMDVYLMGEVLMLACKSLEALGERFCLDVSHMGFISGLLNSVDLTTDQKSRILRGVSSKNVSELNALCYHFGLDDDFCDCVATLATLYGPFRERFCTLMALCINKEMEDALNELISLFHVLRSFVVEPDINLDFSIVNDLGYYNGIIFQGYIEGIPSKVLSGGRYDRLLGKFGKKAGAIGFAVYLDLLERLAPPLREPEPDALLVYGDDTDLSKLANFVMLLNETGKSVRVQRDMPSCDGYGDLVDLRGGPDGENE